VKISLIGAGDVKFHFNELIGINNLELEKHLEEIAIVLKETSSVPVCLTDRGVLFDLVKKFKKIGGGEVIGLAPLSDNTFGISHMSEFINAKIDERKVFDEIIDTGDWYKQDMTHCLFGDVILMLGLTTGSLGELSYGYYLYNLLNWLKSDCKNQSNLIHKKVSAGKKNPFSTIVYLPFIKSKIPFEIEKYIEKFGGKVFYVNDSVELKKILLSLKK
jgi:hypothetical protein